MEGIQDLFLVKKINLVSFQFEGKSAVSNERLNRNKSRD